MENFKYLLDIIWLENVFHEVANGQEIALVIKNHLHNDVATITAENERIKNWLKKNSINQRKEIESAISRLFY